MRMLPLFPEWYVTPLPPSASRAERRRHEAEQVWARAHIRWVWDRACAGTDHARWVVVADRLNLRTPRLGPITLGDPTCLSVELHPGQRPEDVARIADVLAAAFQVPEVYVFDLAPGWVTVELPIRAFRPRIVDVPEVPEVPVREPAAASVVGETPTAPHARPAGRHLSHRAGRRLAGGPQSLRRRRSGPPEPRQPGGSATPA